MPEPKEQALHVPGNRATNPNPVSRSAMFRVTAFSLLWLVLLPSLKIADLLFGAVVVIFASWLSLRLSPPAQGHLRPGKLLLVLPHFLYESARGGIDVALRALAPRLPVNAGLFTYATGFPPGFARNTFICITSLLPGTLACGEEGGQLVYHGLDLQQPLAEQLREEERRLAGALSAGHGHE